MRVVQVTADQVVGVIAMRNGGVPAARPVPVCPIVFRARVLRSARRRVLRADRDPALLHLVACDVVQVSIMEVVGMTFVRHRDVPAARLVLVRVVWMRSVVVRAGHGALVRPRVMATPTRIRKQAQRYIPGPERHHPTRGRFGRPPA